MKKTQKYVLIRSKDSGVHTGYLKSKVRDEVVLLNARRIWYWAGAASLSQLAMEGTKKPAECKFPCTVDNITILGVCEIIEMTKAAQKSIEAVPVWKQ